MKGVGSGRYGKTLINYRTSQGYVKIPSYLADECRRLGIPGDEIKKHYDRWNSPAFRIPSTYELAALRAIEDRKREILKGKVGVKRWLN